MAVLTDADYTELKRMALNNADSKALFKLWSLSKPQLKALFQAAEDWFTSGFNSTPTTSFKASLDAVATTTAAQAKAIAIFWFRWKEHQIL